VWWWWYWSVNPKVYQWGRGRTQAAVFVLHHAKIMTTLILHGVDGATWESNKSETIYILLIEYSPTSSQTEASDRLCGLLI
jgi:hypothetical protein